MTYVILELKGWGNLYIGQYNSAGDLVAVLDRAGDRVEVEGEWKVVSSPHSNFWGTMATLQKLRLACLGEPA